jgi:hypothetical protein
MRRACGAQIFALFGMDTILTIPGSLRRLVHFARPGILLTSYAYAEAERRGKKSSMAYMYTGSLFSTNVALCSGIFANMGCLFSRCSCW